MRAKHISKDFWDFGVISYTQEKYEKYEKYMTKEEMDGGYEGCKIDFDKVIRDFDDEEKYIAFLKDFIKDAKICESWGSSTSLGRVSAWDWHSSSFHYENQWDEDKKKDEYIDEEYTEYEEIYIPLEKDIVFPSESKEELALVTIYSELVQAVENYPFNEERIYFQIQKAVEKCGGYNDAFLEAVKEIKPFGLEEKAENKIVDAKFSFQKIEDAWTLCFDADVNLDKLTQKVFEDKSENEITLDKVYNDYVDAIITKSVSGVSNNDLTKAEKIEESGLEISELKPLSKEKGYFTVKTQNDNLFAFNITTGYELEVKVEDGKEWKNVDMRDLRPSYDFSIARFNEKHSDGMVYWKGLNPIFQELDDEIKKEKQDKEQDDLEDRDDI